jgi:hypothetical protein
VFVRNGIVRVRRDPFDVAAWTIIALLGVLAAWVLHDYAISNDEEVQHRYGRMIVAYYASGFTDRELFGFRNLYLYGGLFDVLAIGIAKLLPCDVYLIRHALCALIGIAGIAAAGATARLVAGPRAGLIAVLLLAVTGTWFGAMFNHTKDIPLAAAMMAAVFFLLRAARDLPRPHWRDVLAFGAFMGAACGLRAIGLLLAVYAVAAIAIRVPAGKGCGREAAAFVAAAAPRFAAAFAVAYVIMIAAWPWAALDPLNPIRAIFAFAHFHYEIRTLLAGEVYLMSDVPRRYVPVYLAIKLPLSIWTGVTLAAAAIFVRAPSRQGATWRREVAILALAAIIPVLCQVLGRGPAFTGMRHFTFVVPPLAVFAAIGFDAALTWLRARQLLLARAAGIALAAAIAWQASLLWRLHPYENLGYNALVGGLPGAAHRYVLDYWVNIMPEAVRRLEAVLDREGFVSAPYYVAVCGEPVSFRQQADPRLRLAEGSIEADFFIAPTHMHCDRAADGEVIVRIERLGVLIGVVKDRRAVSRPARR